MRKLILTLMIATSLVACDTNSSDSLTFDSGKAVKSTAKLDEKSSIESVSSSNTEPQLQQDINTTDWAPLITKTPAKQPHEPFFLPEENIRKLKYFFHKNKNSVNVKDESFFENEHVFYGYIDYLNGTSISYLFNKENNKYFSESFLIRGEYKIIEQLDNSYKDILYKILDISGADNPEIFFQELVNSPKITKYKGCTIHQKQSKYAIVDLTSCEFDNRTDLSLYSLKL